MSIISLDCPQCGKNLIDRSRGLPHKIDNPVKTCPYCRGEYIMPYTIEWGITGIFHKFLYTFVYTCSFIPALFYL